MEGRYSEPYCPICLWVNMRILQVSGVLCDRQGGGVGDHVCSLSRRLVGAGHEVDVLTYSTEPSKHAHDPFVVHRLKVSALPGVGFFQWGLDASKLVRQVVATRRYDVVHAHTTSMGFPLFYNASAPLVITCHGTSSDPVHGVPRQGLLRLLEPHYYQRASKVIAVSNAVAAELYHRGIPKERIEVIPNGTDPARFDRTQLDREAARASLGIGELQLAVLYVGSLTRRKGLKVLFEAITEVLRDEDENSFIFLVAGDGTLRMTAERYALKHRSVRVLGFVSESCLGNLYSASDLFVIPSLYEGLATTLLDAMAFGLPSIASDIPVHCEILANNAGLLVDRGNGKVLAQSLRWARRNKSQLSTMGQAALRAAESFAWDRIAERILRQYQVAMTDNPGRR